MVSRALDEDVSRYLAGGAAGRLNVPAAAAAAAGGGAWSTRSRSASPAASAAIIANNYTLPVSFSRLIANSHRPTLHNSAVKLCSVWRICCIIFTGGASCHGYGAVRVREHAPSVSYRVHTTSSW